jgi:hypothetical protein
MKPSMIQIKTSCKGKWSLPGPRRAHKGDDLYRIIEQKLEGEFLLLVS